MFRMDKNTDILCIQCGQTIPTTTWEKRKSRKRVDWNQCKDCRAVANPRVSRVHPILGRIECKAYMGEVNDFWQPVDLNGDLFMPGERICGASDCVNRNHVVAPKPKQITDLELLLSLVEVQDYQRRSSISDKIKTEPVPRDELTL